MMRTLLTATVLAAGLASVPVFAPAFAQNSTVGAPPTAEYRGGAGSPMSTTATDLQPSGKVIGSRLPHPDTESDSPEALLRAAARAVDQRQTGKAQQALEMAETRVLSRTTAPSQASVPAQQAMVQHIAAARQALGRRDLATAREQIRMAMQAPVPAPGPAVTTVYPGQPGYVPQGQPAYYPGQPAMTPPPPPPIGAPMAPPRAY